RSGGCLVGCAQDPLVGGPPNDRVSALERGLRVEDRERRRGGLERRTRGCEADEDGAWSGTCRRLEARPPAGNRRLGDADRSVEKEPDPLAIGGKLRPRVEPVEGPPLGGKLAARRLEGPPDRRRRPLPRPAERGHPVGTVGDDEL